MAELTRVELRICIQLDEMFAISRCDVVALEVERDIAKCIRVAVDVQRPHITGATTIVMQLLAEEMRKV